MMHCSLLTTHTLKSLQRLASTALLSFAICFCCESLAQLSLDQKLITLPRYPKENAMTRRELLLSLPALSFVPRVYAQAAKPTITVKALNQFTLLVSDVKRSIDFYQGLFGMPIQARNGSTVLLRIGNGPQFVAIGPAGSNPPTIAPVIGVSVENFNPDRIIGVLEQHGVTKAVAGDPGLSGGAMKVRLSTRDRTPELFMGDPEGLVIQIHDTKYCGGSGALGEVCANVEPSPKKGLIAAKNLSHFTINV